MDTQFKEELRYLKLFTENLSTDELVQLKAKIDQTLAKRSFRIEILTKSSGGVDYVWNAETAYVSELTLRQKIQEYFAKYSWEYSWGSKNPPKVTLKKATTNLLNAFIWVDHDLDLPGEPGGKYRVRMDWSKTE